MSPFDQEYDKLPNPLALTLILPSDKPLHDGFNDSIKLIVGESFNVKLIVILEVGHGANPLTVYVKSWTPNP